MVRIVIPVLSGSFNTHVAQVELLVLLGHLWCVCDLCLSDEITYCCATRCSQKGRSTLGALPLAVARSPSPAA